MIERGCTTAEIMRLMLSKRRNDIPTHERGKERKQTAGKMFYNIR
jgi:hypothetical protein